MIRQLGEWLFYYKMSQLDTHAPALTPTTPPSPVNMHSKEQGPSAPELSDRKHLLGYVLRILGTVNRSGLR